MIACLVSAQADLVPDPARIERNRGTLIRLGDLSLWLCIAIFSISAGTFLAILLSRSADSPTVFVANLIVLMVSGLGVLLRIDLVE